MSNEIELKEQTFETTTELIKYLDIPRPTFYRRAKSLGIETNKGTYTLDELNSLRKPLSNPNKGKKSERKDSDNNVTSQKELITMLKQQIEQQKKYIEDLKEQLSVKDGQIRESYDALKRSQQLQLVSTKQGRKWFQFWLPRD
ncbi:MAG: DUF536 domain-containing protein [Leuconostoc mesenteroides]